MQRLSTLTLILVLFAQAVYNSVGYGSAPCSSEHHTDSDNPPPYDGYHVGARSSFDDRSSCFLAHRFSLRHSSWTLPRQTRTMPLYPQCTTFTTTRPPFLPPAVIARVLVEWRIKLVEASLSGFASTIAAAQRSREALQRWRTNSSKPSSHIPRRMPI